MKLITKTVYFLFIVLGAGLASATTKPNIVFLFCDDLGYGDVQYLNPEKGKILTPNLDQMAKDGMIFTDAHSGSSVCTPTRYGLMTGRYSWRTTLQSNVVTGGKPNLIAEDRPTVASYLKTHGYHTGIIGKWHLNFLYNNPETGNKAKIKAGLAPVGTTIPDGPTTRGFDYYHGFHHAAAMKAVIEGDTVIEHDETINMLPRITEKSVAYIQERAKTPEQPFFLYVPFGSPHTPILPTAEWQGKSGLNEYADFVMQNDDSVGQILKALKEAGLEKNTLVILSSDNGCSKAADIPALNEKGHYPSAYLRGSKADLWDGGHRVPFLVKWPDLIAPGTKSDQTICLTDFFATLYDQFDEEIPANTAEDSVSFLPALTGKEIVSTRQGIVHHSVSGHFAYRVGDWKLLLCRGSGGWSSPSERKAKAELPAQLYNLKEDPSEKNNLYTTKPEVAKELLAQLEKDVTSGRSTEGAPSANDTSNIKLWKSGE